VADALPAVFADDVLGLERGALVIAEPDRRWPVAFHRLAALLLPALPGGVVAVEHVGSTAVPGLPAKPILDLAVGVGSTTDAAAADQALQEFGFLRRGEEDGPDLNRNFGLELVRGAPFRLTAVPRGHGRCVRTRPVHLPSRRAAAVSV